MDELSISIGNVQFRKLPPCIWILLISTSQEKGIAKHLCNLSKPRAPLKSHCPRDPKTVSYCMSLSLSAVTAVMACHWVTWPSGDSGKLESHSCFQQLLWHVDACGMFSVSHESQAQPGFMVNMPSNCPTMSYRLFTISGTRSCYIWCGNRLI